MNQAVSYSLRAIFAVTALAAVALATFRYAEACQGLVWTAFSLLITFSIAAAICHRDERRYFWLCFTLFSLGQMIAAEADTSLQVQVMEWLHGQLVPSVVSPGGSIDAVRVYYSRNIGEWWFAAFAGYLGGCVGRMMYKSRGRVLEAGEPSA